MLLPPSESKALPPRRGRPVDLGALSFPELSATRRSVLTALVKVSALPDAVQALGVGASLAAEVERNRRIEELPAAPAHAVYTGVLYDALGWPALSPGAKRRAGRRVLIASAVWGLVRPQDRIPPYRLSIDVDLPGIGPLSAAWRPVAGPSLAEAAGPRGLVVDCRSSGYAAAAPTAGPLAARTAAVRVLREVDGRRSVVSHMAKHTRGEVTRHLLELPADPRRPEELAEALRTRWASELTPPPRPGRTWTLDVVLPG